MSIENIYQEISLFIQSIDQKKLTGEVISNKLSDKHSYITIKNNDYQMNCIGWSKNFSNIKHGMNVEISGSVGLFKKNLSIYFNIKDIKIIGNGAYLNSHAELRQKIIDLGWNLNKQTLKLFPFNIGIITSTEGAAIQDILQTLQTDNFIGNIYISNAIVQGKQCPQSVCNSIDFFEKSQLPIDLLMITRGGGSYDDLVGFSDWTLLEKIHKTPFITLSAVGHQIDNQLSDEVADYKFPTPSLGAKFIVETQKKYLELKERLGSKITNLNEKFIAGKNKINYIRDNYHSIINHYDKKEFEEKLFKYKKFVGLIQNNWGIMKNNFYNKLSNIKPTIMRDEEITSIGDFIDKQTKEEKSPKKVEIIFSDGKVNIYYKIINYEFR
jgi:exodeoxyribonuclease VII large subunit